MGDEHSAREPCGPCCSGDHHAINDNVPHLLPGTLAMWRIEDYSQWMIVALCPAHGTPTCDEFALMLRRAATDVFFPADFLLNVLPHWTMPRCEGCVEELTREQFLKNVTQPAFVPVGMHDRPVWRCERCWAAFTPPPLPLAHPNGLARPEG